MHHYLVTSAMPAMCGVAWCYSRVEPTAVTGATSHVVLALLDRDPTNQLAFEGLQFLLAAQHPTGGWSEVPGYAPTIHNTFNVVRAIQAARRSGVLDGAAIDDTLTAAKGWFLRYIRSRHRPRNITDLAFALRLGAQLEVLHDKSVEVLSRRLSQYRHRWLSRSADLYAETEIAALALLECSRQLDSVQAPSTTWAWRWRLPALPPPFLCRNAYLYDLLYGVFRARWWVRVVDRLVVSSIIERLLGQLLGAIAALGIVDDYVTNTFAAMRTDARGIFTAGIIILLLCLWTLVKAAKRSSIVRALFDGLGPLLGAVVLTWIFRVQAPIFPSLVTFIGTRWLIIDVITATADASGLFDRMLPK